MTRQIEALKMPPAKGNKIQNLQREDLFATVYFFVNFQISGASKPVFNNILL